MSSSSRIAPRVSISQGVPRLPVHEVEGTSRRAGPTATPHRAQCVDGRPRIGAGVAPHEQLRGGSDCLAIRHRSASPVRASRPCTPVSPATRRCQSSSVVMSAVADECLGRASRKSLRNRVASTIRCAIRNRRAHRALRIHAMDRRTHSSSSATTTRRRLPRRYAVAGEVASARRTATRSRASRQIALHRVRRTSSASSGPGREAAIADASARAQGGRALRSRGNSRNPGAPRA